MTLHDKSTKLAKAPANENDAELSAAPSHSDCRAVLIEIVALQPREDDVGNPIYVNTDNSNPKEKLFNAGALSNDAAIEKKMQEVVRLTWRARPGLRPHAENRPLI